MLSLSLLLLPTSPPPPPEAKMSEVMSSEGEKVARVFNLFKAATMEDMEL